MNESGPFDPDQTQEWIDRERERLRGEREQAKQQQANDAWLSALREWLKQLQPGASGAFGGLGQDSLSETLRGMGVAQKSLMEALAKIPPLGLAGGYFEPWTELHTADAEYLKMEERFRKSLIDVHLKTLDELERRLKSRKGGAPANERELFDLWVECGEAVFAKIAHSAEFAQLQGSLSNAAVHRVRAQKAVLEQIARMYDMPTRAELNTVHQQLRTVRRELESLKAKSGTTKREPKAQRKPASKPTGKVTQSSRGTRKVSR
jgi:class III poly(R)-hydroxyalkanoic acid synthase PhaE subunit